MSGADPVEVIRGAYRLFAEEGHTALVARFDEIFTDDFSFTPALVGTVEGGQRTYRGREGFEDYWTDFSSSFALIEFSDPSFERVGDDHVLVVILLKLEGTGSGVPLEQEAAHLYRVEGDRFAEGWTFFSRSDAEVHLAEEGVA